MRSRFLLWCGFAVLIAGISAAGTLGQGNGHGKGKGHNKHGAEEGDEGAEVKFGFSRHDRDLINGYYSGRGSNLPPGLAKRGGNLPPGLEKQLERNGTLPPGLQKR